jgi:hypothetical protein
MVKGPRWRSALPIELERSIRAIIPAIAGWCTAMKACRMAEHVIEIDAARLVELGVYGGRGTVAMALACRHKKSGIVYGVDTWHVESSLVGTNPTGVCEWWTAADLERIYRSFLSTLLDLKLTAFAVPLRMSSADAAKLFERGSVDVLHQDSNHSEEVTCAEVELWWPLVRAGGYWFFDDVCVPTTAKAYGMLLERGCKVEFNDGHWAALRKQ